MAQGDCLPRINIEDSIFRDARFFELAVKLGCTETAIGALVMAWIVAQENWKDNRKYIPIEDWRKRKLRNEIVDCGLATLSSDGIKMAGAEDQFSWLVAAKAAGSIGGKKSAENRKAKGGTAQPKQPLKSPKQPLKSPKGFQPSFSSSPSFSPSFSNSDSLKKTNTVPEPFELTPPENNPKSSRKQKPSGPYGGKVWAAYQEAFKARYGVEPVKGAMANTICSNLVSVIGEEDAINLVKFYLTHNEAFYLKVTHSLPICKRDVQALVTQMRIGKKFTNNDIRQYEKGQHYRDQIERIEKGEL